MGASGSGKSTLMNILGCLDRPTHGRYVLGGDDVSQMADDLLSEIRSRRIGFIFQNFNLIPQLTVLENLEVPMFYLGIPPHIRRKRATDMGWIRVGFSEAKARWAVPDDIRIHPDRQFPITSPQGRKADRALIAPWLS